MKKTISMLIAVLLLVTVPLALAESASPQESRATLTATGNASVSIAPDFATVILGVNTQAETVAAAQEQNAKQMAALIQALTAQGVSREDMSTSYFSVYPVYDYNTYNADGTQKNIGYRVENSLQVTIWNLDIISVVLDAAMASGANQSYGLNFDSTKRGEAYDQALAAAVKEAKRKAAVLADAAEEPLGQLMSIAEQSVGYSGGYSISSKADSVAGTSVLSGTLTVEASVLVTYLVP